MLLSERVQVCERFSNSAQTVNFVISPDSYVAKDVRSSELSRVVIRGIGKETQLMRQRCSERVKKRCEEVRPGKVLPDKRSSWSLDNFLR